MPASVLYQGGAANTLAPLSQTNPLFVELSDGTNALGAAAHPVRTDPTGTTTQPVSAASLPLPSGASTAANQATGNASVASIDGKLPALATGRVPVDGSGVTQPVSAASLPLPTGAATSANQSTGNTSLGTIAGLLAGTLAIVGTVTATVANATLAAGTALIGAVAAALRTDSVMNGTTSLTPKFAKMTLSATGEFVALVSTKKIRVLRYSLMADAACSVYFKSHTAGQISGTKYLAATGGAGGTFCILGHFETTAGEALDLAITGTANVSADITYVEV